MIDEKKTDFFYYYYFNYFLISYTFFKALTYRGISIFQFLGRLKKSITLILENVFLFS